MKKFYCLVITILSLKNISAQIVYDNPLDSGVLVTAGKTIFSYAEPVADGKNGTIVFFNTYQKKDTVFAQRINSAGKVIWGSANSAKIVAIKNSTDSETDIYSAGTLADGNGGVFILYSEYNVTQDLGDLYVQHIDSNGNRLLNPNGVKISGNGHRMDGYALVSDGGSGIIIGWIEQQYDFANGTFGYSEAFVQKLNNGGVAQWQAGGVRVCNANGMRRGLSLASDGSNGVVAIFSDSRNCVPVNNFDNLDVYAQRINSGGVLQWTQNGVPVSVKPLKQQTGKIIRKPDGQGYLIGFSPNPGDAFSGTTEIYVQQLNNSGQPAWQQDGVSVAAAEDGHGFDPAIKFESDGSGGMTIFWNDFDSSTYDNTAFIQRINAAGNAVWSIAPITLLNEPGAHHTALDLRRDVQGNFVYGTIAETADYSDGNFKLQKVDSNNTAKWGVSGKNYSFRADGILPVNDGSIILFEREYDEEITEPPFRRYENLLVYKLDFNGKLVWSSTPYKTMADGNWNDPLIWETGFVPPAAANIITGNKVTVTEDAVCNSLKVLPGGNVIVNTGVTLTVSH